ncbi:hypothetical protein AB0K49_38740 [Streptomyces decoyicus]|uniref:hypothetical protein n=1 Tax=Streptomyces decoyicus TaxID=249567 RepID=UPI00345D0B9A
MERRGWRGAGSRGGDARRVQRQLVRARRRHPARPQDAAGDRQDASGQRREGGPHHGRTGRSCAREEPAGGERDEGGQPDHRDATAEPYRAGAHRFRAGTGSAADKAKAQAQAKAKATANSRQRAGNSAKK